MKPDALEKLLWLRDEARRLEDQKLVYVLSSFRMLAWYPGCLTFHFNSDNFKFMQFFKLKLSLELDFRRPLNELGSLAFIHFADIDNVLPDHSCYYTHIAKTLTQYLR